MVAYIWGFMRLYGMIGNNALLFCKYVVRKSSLRQLRIHDLRGSLPMCSKRKILTIENKGALFPERATFQHQTKFFCALWRLKYNYRFLLKPNKLISAVIPSDIALLAGNDRFNDWCARGPINLLSPNCVYLRLTVAMPVEVSWCIWLFKQSSCADLFQIPANLMFQLNTAIVLFHDFFQKSTIRLL